MRRKIISTTLVALMSMNTFAFDLKSPTGTILEAKSNICRTNFSQGFAYCSLTSEVSQGEKYLINDGAKMRSRIYSVSSIEDRRIIFFNAVLTSFDSGKVVSLACYADANSILPSEILRNEIINAIKSQFYSQN